MTRAGEKASSERAPVSGGLRASGSGGPDFKARVPFWPVWLLRHSHSAPVWYRSLRYRQGGLLMNMVVNRAEIGGCPVVRYSPGERDSRPWGTWEVLATGPQYTLKRIRRLFGWPATMRVMTSAG